MSKEIKLFGLTLRKGSVEMKSAPSTTDGKKRSARSVIKKQPKREVSFQIEDIKSALTLAKNVESPDRKKLLQIYDYIKKDGHTKSQLRVAVNEVLSEPWQIYQGKKVDETTSDLLLKLWVNIIIEYILEAEWYGFTVVELDSIDAANNEIGEVISLDREYVSIEKQWILIEGNINGSYLPYAEIMQEMNMLEFGKRDDYGLFLEVAYNVIWKFYSRSDWSRGSEKYGMPILSIEADTSNDSELDAIESKAANFGTDGYIVVQAGDKVNLIERTGQKIHDIWLDNIKLCNEEISKIINGQTGSSDPKAFVGAAQVQERTMNGFTMQRLQFVADNMNKTVLPYLISMGFKIPEGSKFDYPALVRERERKLNGPLPPADPAVPPLPPTTPNPTPAKK